MNFSIRNVIWALVLLVVLEVQAGAHGIPLPVIVDTDMALDDMRAITMLLNSGMAQIPLIVTSDGALSPQQGGKKMRAILKYLNREDIKVTEGTAVDRPAPLWRAWTEEIRVSEDRNGLDKATLGVRASKEIVDTIKASEDPIIYLCLGPLTNLAKALRFDPAIKDRISMLLYFGRPPDDDDPGWNSLRDPNAALRVFDSGIRIYGMSLPKERLLLFDVGLFERIAELKTSTSQLWERIHGTTKVKSLMAQGHFYVWDEMTVIYMSEPSLFTFLPSVKRAHIMMLQAFEAEKVFDVYLRLLGNPEDFHLSARQSVVLKVFPRDPVLFREDVRPYVERIIQKYGYEEWKACLLTNEFHRHLGIYSIIGAKMGVRARELLEAPFDAITVISYAGNESPLSCMNDGLQVSTGASLGRGTIKISDQQPHPAAAFLYDHTRLRLSLKDNLVGRIQKEIRTAMERFGGLNPAYFSYIRKLSIRYWQDLDRKEIFDESMEQPQMSQ